MAPQEYAQNVKMAPINQVPHRFKSVDIVDSSSHAIDTHSHTTCKQIHHYLTVNFIQVTILEIK